METGTPILVAYASRYGSTAEVAGMLGARLRELGHVAELKHVRDVRSLDGYGAVVIGAPFYMGAILKDARAFLTRHRAQLERLPVALFTLTIGPIRSSNDLPGLRKQREVFLDKLGWLKPVAEEMFVGKYDPSQLRSLDKLAVNTPGTPLHRLGARDGRDWEAVNAWAETLCAVLVNRV